MNHRTNCRFSMARLMVHLAAGAAFLTSPATGTAKESVPAGSNGLAAPTPAMGWNPFNAFRLAYDEGDVMDAAKRLVDLRLASSGYKYVNIDDGWWLKRSGEGIAIRTNLFPSSAGADGKTSFRPFVDRLHGMGLKAGIYSDIGRNNCSQHWDKTSPNLPEGSVEEREVGAMGHYAQDAALFFAEWGFDFIKVDACGVADYGPQSADVRAGL